MAKRKNRGGRTAARTTARTAVNGGAIMKGVAILLALLAIAYVITSLALGGVWNPTKWQGAAQKTEKPKDDDNKPVETEEGVLFFTPRTTASSPVALSATTAAETPKTATLTATVTPENGFISSVEWRSSTNALTVTKDPQNPLKATVTLTGTLTETAQITCMVYSIKTVMATCSVDFVSFPTVSFDIRGFENSNDNYNLALNTEYEVLLSMGEITSTAEVADFSLKGTGYCVWWDEADSYENITRFQNALGVGTSWEPWEISEDFDEGRDGYFFTLSGTLEGLFGKPQNVSVDDYRKAFYSCDWGGDEAIKITIYADLYLRDIKVKSYAPFYAMNINPASYLTGVEGVSITPDGGIVFTN